MEHCQVACLYCGILRLPRKKLVKKISIGHIGEQTVIRVAPEGFSEPAPLR